MSHRRLRIRIGLFQMLIFVSTFLPRLAFAQELPRAKHGPTGNEDARGDAYGDPLPPGALARMGTFRDYIGDGSSRIIFSPDGQFVTASSAFLSPPLRLWSTATGRVVREFQELDRLGMGAGYVAISSDGSRIAVAGYDVVWVGSIATGQRIRIFAGYEYIEGIALSPDGKVLLVRDQGHLSFWDVATGAQTHWPSLAGYWPITFTHYFDVAGLRQSGGTSSLRFGVSGREIRSDRPRRRYSGIAIPLAISPDLRTNTLWKNLAHPEGSWSVAFAPDSKNLATGDVNGVIRVWNVETGEFVSKFARTVKRDVEPPRLYSLAFLPDGKTLVSAGDDHFVTLWDLATGQERRRLTGHAARVNSLAIAPNGKTLASGSDDGTALIWGLTTAGPDIRAIAP
jgi:WD40 repeat protein